MSQTAFAPAEPALDPAKFSDPKVTAKGEARAHVALRALATLWFNTGTLCNLTCENCYIESSPANDRLAYLSAAEVAAYLDEIEAHGHPTEEIGFTGGEPFMNWDLIPMLDDALGRGFRALVLTNGMRPMMKRADALLDLKERHGKRLVLRVSLDHYSRDLHERERGPRSWRGAMLGLGWLCENGFRVHVAGRTRWGESEESLRAGFARLFAAEGLDIEARDKGALVLFPEMDAVRDVAEITTACWDILGVDPGAMMCASSRMVAKRKGAPRPVVLACTLLAYDPRFELGERLGDATGPVALNHAHCARFCVLGGGSCGAAG